MARLWIKIIRNHKITRNETVPFTGQEAQEALSDKLREMDFPSPLWLSKHFSEMEKFGLTSFKADDFVESIRFDALELAIIDDGEKKRSKDPRNEF